ncbi:hypothetical protein [Nitratifractor sp.]
MHSQNVGAPGGCVEALDVSPMPPMIDIDGVLANASFGFNPASAGPKGHLREVIGVEGPAKPSVIPAQKAVEAYVNAIQTSQG